MRQAIAPEPALSESPPTPATPDSGPIDAPSRGTRRVRWGMLATTLIMGAALVGTGVATWVSNRQAAAEVGAAGAQDLFRAVRRGLREAALDAGLGGAAYHDDRPGGPGRGNFGGNNAGGTPGNIAGNIPKNISADLSAMLDDFRDAGLRYIAIATRRGVRLLEAGKALSAAGHIVDADDFPREPLVEVIADGERLRLEATLGPGARGGGRGPHLIIEVEPVVAQSLANTARNHLLVSSAAAVVLLAFALVFWRLGRRADRFEAQLARGRRLAALGEMSAVLGHELRNPLASLKGHAQLVLERTDPDARSYKNAERVVHEAERLELLSRQILDFARTGMVERVATDPALVMRAAAEAIGDPRIRLDVTDAPASWALDRPRLEQVLVNLLKNAVQASPPAAPSASNTADATSAAIIEARVALEQGQLVYVVRDHGSGFPPGEADAVFEPFRTHRVQGTGLGLAIARGIVEAHGGTITAANHPGGGAIVRVAIPAAAATAPTARSPAWRAS